MTIAQSGPYRVTGANRMDDDQGRRLHLKATLPGGLIGTFQQPDKLVDIEFPYEREEDVAGIEKGASVMLSVSPVEAKG